MHRTNSRQSQVSPEEQARIDIKNNEWMQGMPEAYNLEYERLAQKEDKLKKKVSK